MASFDETDEMWSKIPIIVILGATGTGKSKLGIELAKRFSGEVISADSMQLYRGLDIVTNKVTKEEQKEVKHHLIDVVDSLRKFTVVDFRNLALQKINKIYQEKKLPIIVGGTNYYIESLLWKVLVETGINNLSGSDTDDDDNITLMWEKDPQKCPIKDLTLKRKTPDDEGENWDEMSNNELYEKLLLVDPDYAKIMHPNNRRKVIRALQVYHTEGRTLSSILQEQKELNGGSSLGGPLRFPKSCILWLQCEKTILDERLDSRVDTMLSLGLKNELLHFYDKCKSTEDSYTKGIFQSIGLKEFHNFLTLSKLEQDNEIGEKFLNEGIELLKLATRRYARRQNRWVINRFLRKPDRQVPPVFSLDTTNLNLWNENVFNNASIIVDNIINNKTFDTIKPLPIRDNLETKYCNEYCNACEKIFIDEKQWEIHLKSKKHMKHVKRKKKLQEQEETSIVN